MKKTTLLCIALIYGVIFAANSQTVYTDLNSKNAWEDFRERHGSQWQIRWNERTDLPRSIHFGQTESYHGTPEEAAYTFLREHDSLFGFGESTDLRHVRTQPNRNMFHVTFKQFHEEIPVFKAVYKVHLNRSGQVDMANGFYYPGIEISTTPSVSEISAEETARDDLDSAREYDLDTNSELIVYPMDEGFHLAWKIVLRAEREFVNWLYMVDAHTGEILTTTNRVMHTLPYNSTVKKVEKENIHTIVSNPALMLSTTNGSGNAFSGVPNQGSENPGQVTLPRLNTNSDYLIGTYVDVDNLDSGTGRAESINKEYFYYIDTPPEPNFDEVNVYYHVDRFRNNYINGLSPSNPGFTQIEALVHGNSDNASFQAPGLISFGYGPSSDYNNFAWDAQVIFHEYTHAVFYHLNEDAHSSSNDEAGAINEGLSDYFAGAFAGNSRIFRYAVSTTGDPDERRDMENPGIVHYTQYVADEPGAHQGGEFFSSILWTIRNGSVGSVTTDELVYDAIPRLSSDPDFLEFRDALIASDIEENSGTNVSVIEDIFEDHHIPLPDPPDPDPQVTIQGPSQVSWWGSFSPQVQDFSVQSYKWELTTGSGWQQVSVCEVWNYSGTPGQNFELRVTVYDGPDQTGDSITSDPHFVQVNQFLMEFEGESDAPFPDAFGLDANYPNPFNPATQIRYRLPEPSSVSLRIYNMAGQLISTLVNTEQTAGFHDISWDAAQFASGIYLVRMEATGHSGELFTETSSITLIK
jgi:Zn-dependent metalloprotease